MHFRKSSFCSAGGCVEVAFTDTGRTYIAVVDHAADPGGGCRDEDHVVHVRNSGHPEQGTLRYTAAEWQAFLAGVRAGEFG